jgi:hypothetical protein
MRQYAHLGAFNRALTIPCLINLTVFWLSRQTTDSDPRVNSQEPTRLMAPPRSTNNSCLFWDGDVSDRMNAETRQQTNHSDSAATVHSRTAVPNQVPGQRDVSVSHHIAFPLVAEAGDASRCKCGRRIDSDTQPRCFRSPARHANWIFRVPTNNTPCILSATAYCECPLNWSCAVSDDYLKSSPAMLGG